MQSQRAFSSFLADPLAFRLGVAKASRIASSTRGLHPAVPVAAALNTTKVPFRIEAPPCPSYAAFYGHAVGHIIIPFSQIDASTLGSSLGLQIECQFYSYMISLGPRHCQTCHHLGSQIAFGVCLNQSSKTTFGKSSSRLGSPKSRLLNSLLCIQIMAGHATDLKVEIGMTTC